MVLAEAGIVDGVEAGFHRALAVHLQKKRQQGIMLVFIPKEQWSRKCIAWASNM